MVYEKAIRDDGSLYFPQRLSKEFLDRARKTMGSYLFANQYQNEIIPSDQQRFRPEWIRYYKQIPDKHFTFAFIDPAISQNEDADFTGIAIVKVDVEGVWYVSHARRARMTPTEIVNLVFNIQHEWNCQAIGIESVAYQKALLYLISEEMKRRKKTIPIAEVTRSDRQETKDMRILSLVPRFEWGRVLLTQGLHDLEMELAQFPRAAHDDILDALASIDNIAFYPEKEKDNGKPPAPNSPEYERWYIQNIHKRRRPEDGQQD